MRSINTFLQEFYPTHPLETVVKNKYYPRGLTELQIYNYYLSIKEKMLDWIGDRNVAFLLKLGEKQTVLIRNQKGKPIYLTHSNFENLITGRTNVIYVTHPELTNYWIVDIDVGPNLTMNHAQKALEILTHKLKMNNIDSLGTNKIEALTTSPQGIHLIGYLNVASSIDLLRTGLKLELEKIVSQLNEKSKIQFTVNIKGRESNKINFDLSSMYPNSLHISKYSLTKEFLICDNVQKGLKRIK